MNIGFDIDGVLNNLSFFQQKYGQKYFKDRHRMLNKNAYTVKEMFECNDKEEYGFWRKYLIFFGLFYRPRVGSSEVTNRLHLKRDKIFIITSRIKCSEKTLIGMLIRKCIRIWLKIYKIYFDEIIFCPIENGDKAKTEICSENKIQFMIEDNIENINTISEVSQVICFESPYNEKLEGNYIYKTNSLYDCYRFITGLELDKNSEIDTRNYHNLLSNEIKSFKLICNTVFFKIAFPIYRFIVDLKFSYEIENKERLKDLEGCIFVANHREITDTVIIMRILGTLYPHLLLKVEYKQTMIGKILHMGGCIFVDRNCKDSKTKAKEDLLKLLLVKHNIVMFPEGTRNKTQEILLPFKKGAVEIAAISGSPIIPIGITNTVRNNKNHIRCSIGDKIYVNREEDVEIANHRVRTAVLGLIN